jgi:molybdopterin-containing oxidoreductase family iron-sulfur binding subunit
LLNVPQVNHHVTSKYWRSLAELADDRVAQELAGEEFVGADPEDPNSPSRRNFLKIMGASVALAGLTMQGCRRWPVEKLAPYSSQPRGRIPGNPEFYASAWELAGVASGLLVTSYDGRPIKVEGNPSHPYSRTDRDPKTGEYRSGSADPFAQASVLELYDHPDRSQNVLLRRTATGPQEISDWAAFASAMRDHLAELKGSGEGLAVLSEATAGPTLLAMKAQFIEQFPKAKWFEYEPISHDSLVEGVKLATGTPARPVLHFEKASSVLLIDADVIGTHPAHTRYACDWADRRRQATSDPKHVAMSRVFIAESTFSLTGSVADVRVGAKPDRMLAILAGVAAKLGVANAPAVELEPELQAFVNSAAADLKRAGADAMVACGPTVSPAGHALAFAINGQLGANGSTVTYVTDPVLDRMSHEGAIRDLSGKMFAGEVETLLILGGNPAFDAPFDMEFAKNLAKVPLSVHLSLYNNETSQACTWHVPRAHYLESWSDARAWDGSATIMQPLIEALFGGKTPAELLAMLLEDKDQAGEELVRRTWMATGGPLEAVGTNSLMAYRLAMEVGVLDGSAWKTVTPVLNTTSFGHVEKPSDGLFIRFSPDARVFDGRFANNGWLQETPDNITKLVWDNAALFNKADADKLGIDIGDLVEIQLPSAATTGMAIAPLKIAASIQPGQPAGVIGLTLGYGRTAAGHIGNGPGFNTFVVRPSKSPGYVAGVQVSKTGDTYNLVVTQLHHIVATTGVGILAEDERIGEKKYESGKIIHEGTFAEFKENPGSVHGSPARPWKLELFEAPLKFDDPHAWGMSVDMSACIGCNACAVACQAENNIPIVGKFQSDKHREMNWIRIDRYFKGDEVYENPEVVYQPMMCQQCENAPCEQVCPVGATQHDSEGLNVMIYNRCIGTRYCSNNCPYKVRRFNYLDFHSQDPMETIPVPYLNIPDQQQLEEVDPIKRMVYNPEVTVRMRGVMEKCTFCIQRIHRATIAKRAMGEDIVDGEIVTACQQACPTQAIIFGNLNDMGARVTRLQKDVRSYSVLQESVNTRPRTRYMAKVSNPAGAETTEAAATIPAAGNPAAAPRRSAGAGEPVA